MLAFTRARVLFGKLPGNLKDALPVCWALRLFIAHTSRVSDAVGYLQMASLEGFRETVQAVWCSLLVLHRQTVQAAYALHRETVLWQVRLHRVPV